MFKKIKNEIKAIKWANRKLVFTDMKVILCSSAVLMLLIGAIEWVSKLLLSAVF